jgi:hypothetical protein
MGESRIGEVVRFSGGPSEAVVVITDGELRRGDTVRIRGRETDLTQQVGSLGVGGAGTPPARLGDVATFTVADRVRPGDLVFLVTSESGKGSTNP